MKDYIENYWKYQKKIMQKIIISLLEKAALCLPGLNLHLDVNSHPCFLEQKTNMIITIRFCII